MSAEKPLDPTIYQRAIEIASLGNRAVRAAQRDSRERGIANVYSREGRLYWELPNGEVTFQDLYAPGGPLRSTTPRPRD